MPHSLGKTRILIALLSVTAIGVFSTFSWDLFVDSLDPGDPRLCACDKCLLDGDPWFNALVSSSPQPFLTNYSTSKTAFDWWKRLQPEGHDFTYYNTTVANLFQMFRPVPDDVVKPRPDRCRTCAVVGNSGNLRRSRYGPLIDYHDVVIRINHGPTKGFEEDVGQKTTHHVMYPESAVNLDNTTHLVLFAFKHKDLNWLLKSFSPGALNSNRGANKNLVMILNPAFMKYVHEMWNLKNGRYPSTGFMTLMLSMHMCDEISVFGFGADSDGNWDHYFEVLKNKHLKTGPHAGTYESEVIKKLHEQNKIRLFKGF